MHFVKIKFRFRRYVYSMQGTRLYAQGNIRNTKYSSCPRSNLAGWMTRVTRSPLWWKTQFITKFESNLLWKKYRHWSITHLCSVIPSLMGVCLLWKYYQSCESWQIKKLKLLFEEIKWAGSLTAFCCNPHLISRLHFTIRMLSMSSI